MTGRVADRSYDDRVLQAFRTACDRNPEGTASPADVVKEMRTHGAMLARDTVIDIADIMRRLLGEPAESTMAVVRDERGVTHVAIRLPDEEDGHDEAPVIGALCEDTMDNLLSGMFTAWKAGEIEEGLPDCMSCLVRESAPGPIRGTS
jgi:hypothetical protein